LGNAVRPVTGIIGDGLDGLVEERGEPCDYWWTVRKAQRWTVEVWRRVGGGGIKNWERFVYQKEKKRKKLSVILVVLSDFLSEFSLAFYRLLRYQTGEFRRELMRAVLYKVEDLEMWRERGL
jgi:hypothetical protein